jgi:hypothetical protein
MMNPKPFLESNHLTVPVIMTVLQDKSGEAARSHRCVLQPSPTTKEMKKREILEQSKTPPTTKTPFDA